MTNPTQKDIEAKIETILVMYSTCDLHRVKSLTKRLMALFQSAIHKTEKRMIEEIPHKKLITGNESIGIDGYKKGYNKAIDDVLELLNHSKQG